MHGVSHDGMGTAFYSSVINDFLESNQSYTKLFLTEGQLNIYSKS